MISFSAGRDSAIMTVSATSVKAVRHALHHLDGLPELAKAHFVERRALEQIVAQNGRRPPPELDATRGLHAIADRDHDVEESLTDSVWIEVRDNKNLYHFFKIDDELR